MASRWKQNGPFPNRWWMVGKTYARSLLRYVWPVTGAHYTKLGLFTLPPSLYVAVALLFGLHTVTLTSLLFTFHWPMCTVGEGHIAVYNKQTNSTALVRERTIPTERPPLVGQVNANFCWSRGCRVVSATDPHGRILVSLDRSRYFFICTHEAEWTPFQTHYCSENLVAPRIEPGTSGSVTRNSNH
jgi:hypothetical protein